MVVYWGVSGGACFLTPWLSSDSRVAYRILSVGIPLQYSWRSRETKSLPGALGLWVIRLLAISRADPYALKRPMKHIW